MIQALLIDQVERSQREWVWRLNRQLPFGEKELEISKILQEILPEDDNCKLDPVIFFLLSSKTYGRPKDEFVSALESYLKTVFQMELTPEVKVRVEKAFSLPSESSPELYSKAVQAIIHKKERKIHQILNIPITEGGIEEGLIMSMRTESDVMIATAILETAGYTFTEDQIKEVIRVVECYPLSFEHALSRCHYRKFGLAVLQEIQKMSKEPSEITFYSETEYVKLRYQPVEGYFLWITITENDHVLIYSDGYSDVFTEKDGVNKVIERAFVDGPRNMAFRSDILKRIRNELGPLAEKFNQSSLVWIRAGKLGLHLLDDGTFNMYCPEEKNFTVEQVIPVIKKALEN